MTQSQTVRVDTPEAIARILDSVSTIAVVGASPKPHRASFQVIEALLAHGFEVVSVNPATAETDILGTPVFASLAEVDRPIDMVDVFRPIAELPAVAEQAVAVGAKVFWTQLELVSEHAAEIAARGGLEVVMDRCPKIDLDDPTIARCRAK